MPDNTIYRLTDDDVIEMARGCVMGDRYLYNLQGVESGAPLWLFFLDIAEEDRDKVGMVIGNMEQRSDRAINGYPCTMAGWLVHVDDAEAVRAKIREYLIALGFKSENKPEGTGEEE